MPTLRENLSKLLNTSNPDDIAFAPNTHEFIIRIFSILFEKKQKLKVLTSKNEFYSFAR